MNRILFRWLTVLVVLAVPLPGLGFPFSNFYVIGDSLSDQGNLFAATTSIVGPANAVPAADHYANGRFSNGPVYTDVVAAALGLPLTPSILGGNNFAYGGARTTYNTVEQIAGGPLPNGLFPWSLNAQVANFAARNINDPNGLYLVYSGSNDVADILRRSLDPATVIPNAVAGIINAVNAFASAGAHTVVVPNIPDLGLTPAFLRAGATASGFATTLSAQFNAQLHTQLASIAGLDIIEVDVFSLFRNIVGNPAQFGFTNVTTTCYSGFVAPDPAGTECANPDEFLFWDSVHPTSALHGYLGKAVIAAIPVPATLLLVAVGLVMLAAGARRRIARD